MHQILRTIVGNSTSFNWELQLGLQISKRLEKDYAINRPYDSTKAEFPSGPFLFFFVEGSGPCFWLTTKVLKKMGQNYFHLLCAPLEPVPTSEHKIQ